ncbi:D-alanyl-D-alanine carboxypeptidase family protein [Sporosarcina sp.]|uniref:D-alanyl-D-alanine carboxypeptidase family protein n=1 Tax=Sporosarcina sp. TaxID=49982 RepID=UPI00345BEC61
MNRKKLMFIVMIVICLHSLAVLTGSSQVLAREFKDVKSTHPASEAIEWASTEEIIGGFEDRTFRPNTLLTEAQFAAMLTRYYPEIKKEAATFKELDGKIWSNSTYEALSRFHVPLLGYENRAYRNQPMMRGLLAQVISYVNGQSSKLEESIHYLLDENISTGQSMQSTNLLEMYGARNHVTRAQAVLFFHRLDQQGKTELAKKVYTNQGSALIGSVQAVQMKKRAAQKADPRMQPKDVAGYITGQKLPVKPTYIKNILITNKQLPLPKQFAPGENKEARTQFKRMAAEAKKAGFHLTAFSTYRSFDYQTNLYNKYAKRDGKNMADRYSARPAYSEHQTGLAFDIGETGQQKHWASDSFGNTKAAKWLANHAHSYGFILRYPSGKEHITGYMHESWHFRFVGKAISESIYKRGITLEEYVDM